MGTYPQVAFWRVILKLTIGLYVLPVHAQRDGFITPLGARSRVFKVSYDRPITRFLNNHATTAHETKIILEHISHVEQATLANLKNRTLPEPDDPLRTCNFEEKGWVNTVRTHFGIRGWAEPDLRCITELHGVLVEKKQPPLHSVDTLFDTIRNRAQALNSFAQDITDVVLGNWTNGFAIYEQPYGRLAQQCILNNIGAVRVNGKWHIITTFTNAPKEQTLRDFQRQYLMEYITIGEDGNLARPLQMRLPERPEEGEERVTFDNATTLLSSWGGKPTTSFFGILEIEDNLAIIDALDATDPYVQQAEDAVAPSNISILVLPLLLNLVPISLLAEVSSVFMFIYVLLSDVLTVIPLAIKGGELLFIGRKKERAVVLRLSGSLNGTLSETAAAELWAAECGANDNVEVVGIIFLTLSLTFLVIGIVAEFVSRVYVMKYIARRKRILQEKHRLMHDPKKSANLSTYTINIHPSGSENQTSVKERSD